MPDFIQPCHANSIVQTTFSIEKKTAKSRDSTAPRFTETDSPSTRPTKASNIGDFNSTLVSHRRVSVNTASSHALPTSTKAQDVTTIPEGPGFLLCFPEEHLFLLFADTDAIITECSPQEYEAREPGCTAAWCRCMRQVMDWIQHDPISAPLISRQRYLQINALLTEGVENMLSSHTPGTIRKSRILYASQDHTHKGIIQALIYKQQLEENYEFCRGTRNATIAVCPNGNIIPDRNLITNYINLEGITIHFRAVGPNDSGPESTAGNDMLFKYQLLVLLEKEIITPLNKKLKSLQYSKMTKPELLVKLIKILAKYWPRLEQIHPPKDGACRTNYMLIQYIFMKFGFPPPVLRDPNSIDLIHTSLCKKIIGIGLKNSLTLMDKKNRVLETEAVIDEYTKHYLKNSACFFPCSRDYKKYLIPDVLNFNDLYIAQMKHLTKAFIDIPDQPGAATPAYTRPQKGPLHTRKSHNVHPSFLTF
ncbi:hypothetical protein [Endozoicomonas sp. SCSIO W0465]|uniref:hypothetical protein n=1 Tax=Endozoicomonas sp. SCSIO W0465 TaxID=2918516 RepID=UPI0020751DE9|nr:hypothetical protein [Endozoicomonas sp. SCSIO W0465]USE34344.1 hypothetical protein MJO57_19580 [Endozoicomonas sp. SCSIO W0465]